MSELSERISGFTSRLREQKTQLALASGVAVIVIIAAAVALPGGEDTVDRATDTTSESSSDPGAGPDGSADPDATSGPGVVAGPGSSSGVVTAPRNGDAPSDGGVGSPKQIKVGIAYLSDPGTANAAAGFGGIGQVDQKRAWDAMIAEVNRNEAFGRKLVPVYYAYTTDDVTSKGAERLYQEICARFTQDEKVFIAFVAGAGDSLQACLSKAKVPQLASLAGLSYAKTYRDFPYLVTPYDAALDRMAEFQVDSLFKQGYFKKFKNNSSPYTPTKPADGKPKIGLIRYDQPSYNAAASAMKKRLKAHGLSLCSGCEFEISYSSDNVQEQLDDATEVNAAIQNCKSRPGGPCTHMLFLGSTAGVRITLFFVDGAEKQQYRPLLGFNPLDAPTVVRDFLGPASYPQFRESMIVAWDPADYGEETATFKKCKALFEKAGESFSGDEGSNKLAQIPGYCDVASYFIAASKAAGPDLTVNTWMDGVATVPLTPSAGTYRMKTTANRHDGVGAIRVGKWSDACNCFKPSTGVLPV